MDLECTVFAEWEQFCLKDSRTEDLPDWLASLENHRMLAVEEECIGIGTVSNAFLRVHLEVRQGKPDDEDLTGWDQVNECSLHVPSGRVMVEEVGGREEPYIDVPPGEYRVRIYYGRPSDPFIPSQHYVIAMWRAVPAPIWVLKCRVCGGACRYKEIVQTRLM